MCCKNCGEDKPIVNKWFQLCLWCNNLRLHGSKYGKQRKPSKRKEAPKEPFKKANKGKNTSIAFSMQPKPNKAKTMYEKDNEFYKECFETFKHRCEECGCKQPENFLDSSGKVAARYRYSHIVPKSIAPELRHEITNINDLCLKCHGKWEGEEKVNMSIYKTNKERPLLKKFFQKIW